MANRIIIELPQDWTEYMCELLLNRLIDQELPVEAIAKLEFAKVEPSAPPSPEQEQQPYESFVAEQGANLDAPYEGEEQQP